MGNNENFTDEEVYILVDEDGNEVFLDEDLEVGEPVVYEDIPEEAGDTVVYGRNDIEEALEESVGEVELEDEFYIEEPSYDTGLIDFDEEEDPGDDDGDSSGNRIILLLGALIIVLAVAFLGIFYFTKKAPKEKGVDFTSVGTEVASIGIIGEENIAAITTAEGLRLDALYEAQKSYDYEEADQENGVSSVNVTLTSIVKDLKIKIVNSKGKLIGNVPFVVEVTSPGGKTEKWEDDNKDGIIYKSDLEGGIYKVKLVPLNGYDSMYDFSSASIQSLTVKSQLDYQKVDVKNEIKQSNQVDASEDAAAKETEVESILKDTVAYVVSAKVASSEGYKAVSKDTIKDPMKALIEKNEASIGRFKRLSDTSGGEGGETSGNNQDPPPHVHTWSQWTPDGEDGHKRTCTCGESEREEKCDDLDGDGVCDYCGRKLAKHEHAYVWKCDEATKTHWQECSLDNCPNAGEKINSGSCELEYKKDDASFNMHRGACKVCGHVYPLSECVDANNDKKCDLCGGKMSAEEIAITYTASSTALSLANDKDKVGTVKVTVTKNPPSEITKYTWEVETEKKDFVTLADTSKDTVKITALKAGTVNIRCNVEFKDGKKATGAWQPIIISTGTTITLDRTTKKAIFVDGDKFTVVATVKGAKTGKVTWTVNDTNLAKLEYPTPAITGKEGDAERKATCIVSGLKPGTVTLTCTSDDDKTIKQTLTIVVLANPKTDKTTKLVDNNGKQVYKYDKSSKKYLEATYADYYSGTDLFIPVEVTYIYTGWWTIDGKTYYFDANGKKVTGDQVILGAKYSFDSNGVLKGGTGLFGIDVSTWNGTIDWNQVAKSGVSYAIIRCGYRGTTLGGLVEDNKFATNIKNATGAGIKVGVYFFTQAVSEAEAVEEASMCLSLVEGYKLSYPIFIDVESGSGNARANGLSKESRTAIVKAFCKTISNSGYKAGIYANKNWFTNKINTSELTGYTIWLAQYSSAPTYTATRYDLWQYSSQGSIKGISGNVDLDLSYLGY
ncbi:MAG: hypothetical protein J5626_06495 [Lachnospiraceae bacterium]|nr:hypothetical protein [Lachnospiraceae bacterium]